MDDTREKVPGDGIFSGMVSFSGREMDEARDFESIVDARLLALKQQIMDEYERRCPKPPACWDYSPRGQR